MAMHPAFQSSAMTATLFLSYRFDLFLNLLFFTHSRDASKTASSPPTSPRPGMAAAGVGPASSSNVIPPRQSKPMGAAGTKKKQQQKKKKGGKSSWWWQRQTIENELFQQLPPTFIYVLPCAIWCTPFYCIKEADHPFGIVLFYQFCNRLMQLRLPGIFFCLYFKLIFLRSGLIN